MVYLLHGLGMSTGVDLDQLAATGQWVSEQLGRPNGSRVGRALHANAERLRTRLCQPSRNKEPCHVNTLAHGLAGKEVTYSISELAHEFDITPRTIRYYEDEGLITPTGRADPSTATRTRSA